MLGHRLWTSLQREHDTWVTIRGSKNIFPDKRIFPPDQICYNVDALIFDEVVRSLATVQPDLVINCIGLIKQAPLAKDPLSAIRINAMLPHQLALVCKSTGIRFIHVSTDCIFSGNKGNYTEDEPSDAVDLYGRTKFLGEVSYPNTITLRTSIIGRELKSKLGLIEWFLAQEGEIDGYRKAIFSGMTTDELSSVIQKYVIPNEELSGLYHVSSEPISKYQLLVLAKQAFDKQIEIRPYDDFVIDRSLDSSQFRKVTGYKPPSWEAMIDKLAGDFVLYDNYGG
jgi:dTDP-4-dehydrorhamnose reductase